MSDEPETPVENAIRVCMEHTGWTREETVAVLGAVRAETPDALLEALPEVVAWCERVERQHETVDLLKRMPRGVLEVRWTGDDLALRLAPNLKVEMVDGLARADMGDEA